MMKPFAQFKRDQRCHGISLCENVYVPITQYHSVWVRMPINFPGSLLNQSVFGTVSSDQLIRVSEQLKLVFMLAGRPSIFEFQAVDRIIPKSSVFPVLFALGPTQHSRYSFNR